MGSRAVQDRILLAVALCAAAFIQVSIAASQVLLGIGILLLLVFRQKLAFPRIWTPLVCLFLWTALADVLSPDPWLGRAQIKKFFVFLLIPLIYMVFREQFAKIYYLVVAWAVGAVASALTAIVQFWRHGHESYISYVGQRITGFESHWMTFGGLQLLVMLMLLAHWFFARKRMPLWVYSSVAILGVAILLGGTRSIWIAALPAVLYLVWMWQPKMILAVPVLAAIGFLVAPSNVRVRLLSLAKPQENIDSNRFRAVTRATGMEMIKAHPWFGLGPEEIKRNFDSYVPASVAKPLPVGFYGHLHNIYLQYAAERGIPGLLCVLWLVGLAAYDAIRGLMRLDKGERSQERFLLQGLIAVTIGILIEGLAEYNLGDSEVLMMYLSIVALSYAALAQLGNQQVFTPRAQTVSK
jgi:putative inorganic carbon (hco3(-)) transporter